MSSAVSPMSAPSVSASSAASVSAGDENDEREQAMYNTSVRHGFQVIAKEWMVKLAEGYFDYFTDKRHETHGRPADDDLGEASDWRVVDRRRTVNAALVLCLNLGVDPPDVIKTQPAARLEAWVDPQHFADTKKSLEQIGKNLQSQYEALSARVKYKQSLDPNIDDIKRFCVSLRRSARDDRILFHYNGHGVPRPTPSGEIWVFNRGYTQYIPLSMYDLQSWLGAPVIYCYDCSGAGNIMTSFDHFVQKRQQMMEQEQEQAAATSATSAAATSAAAASAATSGAGAASGANKKRTSDAFTLDPGKPAFDTCIQLAACRADEILPMNPALPADLFTCCITTPVDIAVKWFLIQNGQGFASSGLDSDNVKIPGKISDRRTPLGELNWIFTAITDTIAWSALDTALFKKLFRQDLIVAAMFRNFLLANRIMRTYNCHPQSSPALPDTHDHPLWDSWDAAINHCLLQISSDPRDGMFSDFFEQQLTAFEMWLNYQSSDDEAPEQLPVLLQVLLSQIHRLRALSLLCRYLDLGPKAVRVALNIDFFIYVLKLLQSPAPELRPVLVFIWARITAVDQQVQTELIKDNGYQYFVNILVDDSETSSKTGDPAMCCFILAQFTHGFPNAQQLLAGHSDLLTAIERNLEAESPLLRQWSILLLCELVPLRSLPKILWRLKDPIAEVRASVLYALSAYISRGRLGDTDVDMVGKASVSVALDGSPLVRTEFVMFVSQFIYRNHPKFLVCAFTTLEEEFAASKYGGDLRSQSPAHGTVSLALWRCLLVLSDDSMPYVRDAATKLIDFVQLSLAKTPLEAEVRQMSRALLDPRELDHHIGSEQVSAHRSKSRASRTANRMLSSADTPSSTTTTTTTSTPSTASTSTATRSTSTATRSTADDDVRYTTNAPASPPKSLLKKGIDWLVGPDAKPEAEPRLKTKASLASLVSDLHLAPPAAVDAPRDAAVPPRDLHSFVPPAPPAGQVQATVSDDGQRLKLRSAFREFCVEYFREPQLKPAEADEPGSKVFYEKTWRKSRNERILAETQVQKDMSVTGSWNNHITTLQGLGEPAKSLCFAQFETHLLTGDSQDVAVFNWEKGELLNRFRGGRDLASVQLINEDDQPLVLAASRDGQARVFRNYESSETCEIVSSWWLFADLVHHQAHSPTVLVDWQQSRGHLLVGGDARVVRIWDAAREQAVGDIPVRTSSQLTALTSDKVAGHYFFTGFSDGAIHVYDRRLDKQSALVRRWKPRSGGLHSTHLGHASRIINLRMQRGGTREVVSGSTDGQICLWDMRWSDPVGSFRAHAKDMACMDVHEHAPVIGTASRIAGVWSTTGRRVSTLKGPSSADYMSSKVHPVGGFVFHPHQMVLAMSNATEPVVSVYKCTS